MDAFDAQGPRWVLKPADEAAVTRLESELGLARLVCRTLVARGVDTPEKARAFMHPSLEASWQDPTIIPGLAAVADEVERALDAHERIAVFGDFDVDGITATAVLSRALRAMGGDVVPFVPRRYGEGYGLSVAALTRLLASGPQLVVTVDNGIAAKEEAAWLAGQGVRLAITDHHEAAGQVPVGIPVCDPKIDDEGPSRELAGVGVALKLVCELGRRRGMPELWRQLTDLACLGTVADLMPFTEENRAIVADGIARINASPRPGIAALAAEAHADTATMTAESLSFSLIPRINAAGRVADPVVALDLMLTDDVDAASEAAQRLGQINEKRRAIEADLTELASDQARQTYAGERALVLGGEGWHEGVKGIVASRMAGIYHVPTILFSIQGDIARGSGRTVGSINLFKAVSACSDLLERFGGHEAAVGVTLKTENLPEFRRRLIAEMDALPERSFVSVREVDASVGLGELTYESLDELRLLEPYGQGMRTPLFVCRHVFMEDCGAVGRDGSHLRFTATDGVHRVQAIEFRCPDLADLMRYEGAVDVVFEGQAEEWHGRRQAKMIVRDIEPVVARDSATGGDSQSAVVKRIMDHADEYLQRDRYAGIGEAVSFHTKVAGVTFDERQQVIAGLRTGDALGISRDAGNEHDPNAIRVMAPEGQVGFLNARLAERLAPLMDAGARYEASVTEVTGGMLLRGADDGQARPRPASLGLNIEVRRAGTAGAGAQAATAGADGDAPVRPASEDAASIRRELAQLEAPDLDARLRQAFIGDAEMHQAQVDALAHLAAGQSTLLVMATGRGKSLVFHLHAARMALARHKASVFVYPLRALVADQRVHLSDAFARIGLVVRVLTGETGAGERAETFAGMASGDVHVVLTTPEFLALHADEFACGSKVGFLAVDEAHHIGLARAGNRSAYGELPAIRAALGEPTCLAATATCRPSDLDAIEQALGPVARVLDPSVRENLRLDDRRSGRPSRSRDAYLATIATTGEKVACYTTSRTGAVALTRSLRKWLPDIAGRIAYYHGGLPRAERAGVEEAFRSGEVSFLVCTSAFGEGVNIPDIRHVVLYHLPMNDVEFNQMSGRAGRDGREATVHLLYGQSDAAINRRILSSTAPSRNDLASLYRTLRRLAGEGRIGTTPARAEAASGGLRPSPEEDGAADLPRMTRDEIVEECLADDVRCGLDAAGVSHALAIFSELGFVRLVGRGSKRAILFVDDPARVPLASSVRYREGLAGLDSFEEFARWACEAPADELLARINRPILPL